METTNKTITFVSMFADHFIDTGKVKIQFRNHLYTTDCSHEIEVLSKNPRVKVHSRESISEPVKTVDASDTNKVKKEKPKGGKNA